MIHAIHLAGTYLTTLAGVCVVWNFAPPYSSSDATQVAKSAILLAAGVTLIFI